jgi:hypothetical protein
MLFLKRMVAPTLRLTDAIIRGGGATTIGRTSFVRKTRLKSSRLLFEKGNTRLKKLMFDQTDVTGATAFDQISSPPPRSSNKRSFLILFLISIFNKAPKLEQLSPKFCRLDAKEANLDS